MSFSRRKSGLSALEILIMLTVLFIVAAVTYPKFRALARQSHEASTKNRLGRLRGAVSIYYAENFGLYPSDRGDPATRLSSSVVPRYLSEMPAVDLPHFHPDPLGTVQEKVTGAGDWYYGMLDGRVGVNSLHADTKGQPITSW